MLEALLKDAPSGTARNNHRQTSVCVCVHLEHGSGETGSVVTSSFVPPLAWSPLVILHEFIHKVTFSVAMSSFLHLYNRKVEK